MPNILKLIWVVFAFFPEGRGMANDVLHLGNQIEISKPTSSLMFSISFPGPLGGVYGLRLISDSQYINPRQIGRIKKGLELRVRAGDQRAVVEPTSLLPFGGSLLYKVPEPFLGQFRLEVTVSALEAELKSLFDEILGEQLRVSFVAHSCPSKIP